MLTGILVDIICYVNLTKNQRLKIMIITDVHMHTNNSGDSQAPMSEMVSSAINKGLKHICFTDHYDMDFPYTINGEEGMFELDLDKYRKDYESNLSLYGDKIDLNFGIELGIMPTTYDKLRDYLKDKQFDFIIGSSHTCTCMDVYYPAIYEGRTDVEVFNMYFSEIYDNICNFTDFDIYAHLDYVVRYAPNGDANYKFSNHADIFEAILKRIIELGKGIELNTGGLRARVSRINPSEDVLKMYHSLGGEIITIGADAHSPEDVAHEFKYAEELLKGIGFKYLAYYKNRKPEFIKL